MTEAAPIAVAESTWRDVLAAVEVARAAPSSAAAELAAHLYSEWYLGSPAPLRRDRDGLPAAADLNLVDLLRARHADSARCEPGWSVTAVSSRGRVAVSRDGEERVLPRVDVLPLRRPGLPPRAGDEVRITARRDTVDPTGAFWFAYAGDWDGASVPPGLVRFYWHVARHTMSSLVGSITSRLARTGASYALKVAVGEADADRPDAAVLYVTPEEVDAALPALGAAHRELAPRLEASVPRLALRLGRGLAVAEDPDTGESFGQHRCRIVAEALADAAGAERAGPAERAAVVVERLRAAGIDPDRPHLRPGSTTEYEWPPD